MQKVRRTSRRKRGNDFVRDFNRPRRALCVCVCASLIEREMMVYEIHFLKAFPSGPIISPFDRSIGLRIDVLVRAAANTFRSCAGGDLMSGKGREGRLKNSHTLPCFPLCLLVKPFCAKRETERETVF